MSQGKMMAAASVASLLVGGIVGCGGGDPDTIALLGRQNSSGTYEYFREATLGKKGFFRQGISAQSGSKDVVEQIAGTPSGIGYSGMGYATDEVKVLRVSKKKGEAGVAATLENARSGSYPLARNLYIYTLGEPEGAAKHYIAWILSAQGQKIVENEGYVPNPQPGPSAAGTPPKATITVEGSDTLVQVAGKWAEVYFKQFPQVRILVGGGGSGKGIAALIDGTTMLANASREMKASEKEKAETSGKKINEIVIGKDALAVFVHKDNPIDSISLEELKEIYGKDGKITKWSQLTSEQEGK